METLGSNVMVQPFGKFNWELLSTVPKDISTGKESISGSTQFSVIKTIKKKNGRKAIQIT